MERLVNSNEENLEKDEIIQIEKFREASFILYKRVP